MPDSGFDSYSSPAADTAYSPQFFQELTFQQATGINYPMIAPSGAIRGWVFSNQIPTTAEAVFVMPNEVVPHLDDLLPILREAREVYSSSRRRAVHISVTLDGKHTDNIYHFSKVCNVGLHTITVFIIDGLLQLQLIKLINNNRDAVAKACRISHRMTTDLGLSHTIIDRFENQCLKSPIAGFYCTDFPLWKLGCLLDEEWIEEDVLNGMSELLYFRIAATTEAITFLYLPTSMFNDARRLYACSPWLYGPNLELLRQLLGEGTIKKIAFCVWHNNHYHGFLYDASVTRVTLTHGDSQHGAPPPDIIPIFAWMLAETPYLQPEVIQTGVIGLQLGPSGGYGSCAIAAHNFVECRISSNEVPQWDASASSAFRDRALVDLIIFHCCAVDAEVRL